MQVTQEALAIVRAALAEELDVDLDKVAVSTRLDEDLGLDSIGRTALAEALESRTGAEIGDTEIMRLLTVGQVVDLVAAKASALEPSSGR